MAFIDRLGQVANKAGAVAGDTFDYGKAKGKIVSERGKIKDAKEAIGDYVYQTLTDGEELDMEKIQAYCTEIDGRVATIDRLQQEAKKSGQDLSGEFKRKEDKYETAGEGETEE